MMVPDSDRERIARAKAYPFGHPAESYLFRAGRTEPVRISPAALRGRVPVIASGSNAAPDQLRRKFAAHEPPAEIPVTRARLAGFDSVYNAHIAAYGSVPATLFPSAGTVLTTFVTWLDEAELAVMHATEQPGVHYHFTELRGLDLDVEGAGRLSEAFAYISVAGCLVDGEGPVGLADVPAEGRRFPARTQEEILARVRDLTAPGTDLDAFILETVADAALRRARAAALARTARPFAYPDMRVIPVQAPDSR